MALETIHGGTALWIFDCIDVPGAIPQYGVLTADDTGLARSRPYRRTIKAAICGTQAIPVSKKATAHNT
jgi:hypothetical protein